MGRYEVVQALLEELAAVFPDRYVHLGGDEVDGDCWQSDPTIAKWARRQQRRNPRVDWKSLLLATFACRSYRDTDQHHWPMLAERKISKLATSLHTKNSSMPKPLTQVLVDKNGHLLPGKRKSGRRSFVPEAELSRVSSMARTLYSGE